MAISLTIDGAQVALKKGSSIEYVSENRIFTDADDYSMTIELPLASLITIFMCFSCLKVCTEASFLMAFTPRNRQKRRLVIGLIA